ncbi:uroporphyrinogen-III synthase [Methylotenera sp.]|uniref:uroporphyrinogen-III synthase n=1 Tax=Methylotenera sp. TaxID=2051956 RepID=UPI0027201429|nr:uroporphyrinogen-III synthase [Methylotenera sp.]MDO9205750.1 uroporphyrinogen-III synthase [Methylotenera sp.]MDO9394697.1 uroporphyrinogen-III synthase [Methylotenera sp.]MDP1522929.1 uroporphyrinogen-III synthase [Methylotenera sp.]MDP2072394.1 uroporphyrinogen-III synthase [Methylotenera sp.]MDP2229422.1 uroporphyrinogen-III synthase [Methylotenera sp.]
MADDLLNGLHVAVTRPVDQATSICEAIHHHGGKATLFPLLAISPLQDYSEFEQTIASLETADWAIFISTNAVDNALPRIIKKFGNVPRNLKFAAIGHQTARELALYGIHDILTPHTRFDSETLLALGEMHDVANETVVIFRGVGGRDVMADTLKSRGANVIFAECYRRINPQTDAQSLNNLWHQDQLDAVIVTSSEAMRNLLDMAGESEWLRHVTLCVNHARIAELPLQFGFKVLVTDAPGDDAMIKCLSQVVNKHG